MRSSLHRRFCAALATCVALLTAACAPAGPSTGPAPLGSADWMAESSAGEIAARARRVCGRAAAGKPQCIEAALVDLVGRLGVARGMEVLDSLLAVDADVRQNGHELAHGMGIAAYRSPETLTETFTACPAIQGAGCHHGVVQGYFLSLLADGRLPGTAELDALCEPHRGSIFLYAQCAHGAGHGLMAVHANHVPRTLAACDLATDGYIRESCYGGVFMENIIQVTHPHHTTGGHGAAQGRHASADGPDAHGDHGAHGAAEEAWRALDPADPLYPCTVVAEKYQPSCYTMQTGAVLHFTRGSVHAAASACEGAPERMMPICFGSLGRDVMALAALDHAGSLALCGRAAGMAGGRGDLWCMVGLVQNLVNLAADPDEGMRFCRQVTADAHKAECYRAVGELVLTLVPDERRGESCRAAEPAFVAACRTGARLADEAREEGGRER